MRESSDWPMCLLLTLRQLHCLEVLWGEVAKDQILHRWHLSLLLMHCLLLLLLHHLLLLLSEHFSVCMAGQLCVGLR